MKNRIFAWAVLALVVFACFKAYATLKNPWTVVAPVIQLPPASNGCSKDCGP